MLDDIQGKLISLPISKSNDVLVVDAESCPQQIKSKIVDHLRAMGHLGLIVFAESDFNISKIDESEMNRQGWYRERISIKTLT